MSVKSHAHVLYLLFRSTHSSQNWWGLRAPGERIENADSHVPQGHILIQLVWVEVPGFVFLTSATGNSKASSLNSQPATVWDQ